MSKGYWKCEFEGKKMEMTPKYETLREATDEEAKKFKTNKT